jgi:hypothetical protein
MAGHDLNHLAQIEAIAERMKARGVSFWPAR